MAARAPRTSLATHEVTNQPPPFEGVNLFTSDRVLTEAVARAGADVHAERLVSLGAAGGDPEVQEWARLANRHTPELDTFDRYGRRIDEVRFHPAYHALMDLGLRHAVSALAWRDEGRTAGHAGHVALEFLLAQIEPSVCCPITMTYAAPAALAHAPGIAAEWLPRIRAASYDSRSIPASEKTGVTIGMAMTEKQGGSDVRANTTRAEALDGTRAAFSLTGHKWFCSAPMCDAFLTLAYTENGLTCFLVPRWRPDGTRNPMHVMRLKEKLGDKANASSEIEYHGAYAERVGEEGRGIRTIIDMVQHTRLDCIIAPAAYMRITTAHAIWHTSGRTAFQRRLIDQPAMRGVLADLAIESEAATMLTFRIAQAFDRQQTDAQEEAFARVATPVAKYWLNKRVVGAVAEALEAHGGAGYVEETILPRYYRQAPLNGVWEGSGNVICLDVLRAMGREPEAVEALQTELLAARGADRTYDAALAEFAEAVRTAPGEAGARRLVERMALALQASLLIRFAPSAVADAFVATRLGHEGGSAYGTLPARADLDAIIARATPVH